VVKKDFRYLTAEALRAPRGEFEMICLCLLCTSAVKNNSTSLSLREEGLGKLTAEARRTRRV